MNEEQNAPAAEETENPMQSLSEITEMAKKLEALVKMAKREEVRKANKRPKDYLKKKKARRVMRRKSRGF